MSVSNEISKTYYFTIIFILDHLPNRRNFYLSLAAVLGCSGIIFKILIKPIKPRLHPTICDAFWFTKCYPECDTMKCEHYFYNCSKDYIKAINDNLFDEIVEVISLLPKRQTQSEINNDLFWLLTIRGWSYDTMSGVTPSAPADLKVRPDCSDIEKTVNRQLCLTTTTLNSTWRTDFAKMYGNRLVQLEAQLGKVESMFKDFCGFRIARFERRLELGIEIVMSDPNKYFAHMKSAVSEVAYFEIAKKTLPALNLDCPIWLVGIKE